MPNHNTVPTLAAVLVALAAALAWTPPCAAGDADAKRVRVESQWRKLEAAGVTIASIEVVVRGVYPETGQPLPWYERAANAMHVETDEPVILAHLNFAVGEKVNSRRIYETERRLRSLKYVREAVIEPGPRVGDGVLVRILIDDAWSLKFSVSYDSTGGQVRSGYSVEDSNLLGSGKSLSLSHSEDVARDTNQIRYSDPSLFGSHWTFDLHHDEATDGASDGFGVGLPFMSSDSTWAFAARFDVSNDEIGFWNAGEQAYAVAAARDIHSVEVGRLVDWSDEAGWRTRLALQSETYRYGPLITLDASLREAPLLNGRELTGVVWSIERFHDHYQSVKNLALVDRFEDYNLGFDARLDLGRFPQFLGSTMDASTAQLRMSWAATVAPDDMLFWRGEFGLRRESGVGASDGLGSSTLTYYLRRFPPHTLVGRAHLEWRERPDPEHELYLGGLDGLYGYPSYYKLGDRRWTLHLEDRVLGELVLFNTFRVGYAAFIEAGQIRRTGNETEGWGRVYADVGGGLRIGSLRGAFGNVLYFMVAVPLVHEPGLSSYQLVIGDSIEF